MNKVNKIIARGLLFPILILNFSFGPQNSCQTMGKMELMVCCDAMISPIAQVVEYNTSLSCACQTSENLPAETPLAILADILKSKPKKIDKHIENDLPHLTSILDSSNPSNHFGINSKPRFFSNLKIYDLVSSYLI